MQETEESMPAKRLEKPDLCRNEVQVVSALRRDEHLASAIAGYNVFKEFEKGFVGQRLDIIFSLGKIAWLSLIYSLIQQKAKRSESLMAMHQARQKDVRMIF